MAAMFYGVELYEHNNLELSKFEDMDSMFAYLKHFFVWCSSINRFIYSTHDDTFEMMTTRSMCALVDKLKTDNFGIKNDEIVVRFQRAHGIDLPNICFFNGKNKLVICQNGRIYEDRKSVV